MYALLLAVIYLVFVSLGLPDSLLGAGWPKMQETFGVPSSYAGYVSMMVSFMTILAALIGPKLIRKVHTKWIVAVSIFLTILGLLGFSFCPVYGLLFVIAIPYGLGAGAIDASINNYVANHYSASVMNFLHCFYGLGAVISPNIMALALKNAHWNEGYRWTAYIQIGIWAIVLLSLPLWSATEAGRREETHDVAGIRETFKVPGVLPTLIAFFAYCAGEATCFLWTPSYFAGTKEGMSDELIASFGSLICGGLMLGRLISGFASKKLSDKTLIRVGIAVEIFGILLVMLPLDGYIVAAIGYAIVGIGMGPVYPSIQHMAPEKYGRRYSASVIGLQMAAAYVGNTFMPMVFGNLQQALGIWVMPYFLLVFALINIGLLEYSHKLVKKRKKDGR